MARDDDHSGGGDHDFRDGGTESDRSGGEQGHASEAGEGKSTGGFEIGEAGDKPGGEENPFTITEKTESPHAPEENAPNPFMNSLEESPDATVGKKADTETDGSIPAPVSTDKKEDTVGKEKTETREGIRAREETERKDQPEAKEITREQALEEISFRSFTAEELENTEKAAESSFMTNGHGERMSRADAVNTMLADLSESLGHLRESDRMISDDQMREILADVKASLYAQEAESMSRAIGNHGIPHLYSVYERMHDAASEEVLHQAAQNLREKNPDSRATVDDFRAAMVLAAVYHDEGYLSSTARQGAGHDLLHGVDSAIAFEHNHADRLKGAIDPTILDEVRQAIAEHNGLPATAEQAFDKVGEEMEGNPARSGVMKEMDLERNANLDPNDNFVRSALLLSDRLALDTAEKMPDVLRNQERAQVMIQYYQQQAEHLAAPEQERMRGTLKEMVLADDSLDEAQRQAFLDAIEKDITVNAGKFDLPMAGVAIPADALQYRVVQDSEGKAHIEAAVDLSHRVGDWEYTLAFDGHSEVVRDMKAEGTEGEARPAGAKEDGKPALEAAQLSKGLKDYGITGESMRELHGDGTTADWLVKSDTGVYVVQTRLADGASGEYRGIDGLEHVTIRISEMSAEDEKRMEPYMEKALNETSKKADETIRETDRNMEALEAEREEARAAEAQLEISREAMADYRSIYDRNEVTAQDMITLCAALYSEENRERIDSIVGEIAANPELDPDRLAELARACADLKIPEAEEKKTERNQSESGKEA